MGERPWRRGVLASGSSIFVERPHRRLGGPSSAGSQGQSGDMSPQVDAVSPQGDVSLEKPRAPNACFPRSVASEKMTFGMSPAALAGYLSARGLVLRSDISASGAYGEPGGHKAMSAGRTGTRDRSRSMPA